MFLLALMFCLILAMIFELIQVAFGYRKQLSRQLSLEEWRKVYKQASKQTVIGIVFQGIQKLPKEQWPPQSILYEWIGQTEQIRQQNRKVNAVLKELATLFNANNIRYAVVKGQIEATGIKITHFLKFMPLAPAFSWNWLLAELKRKISKKLR